MRAPWPRRLSPAPFSRRRSPIGVVLAIVGYALLAGFCVGFWGLALWELWRAAAILVPPR